MLKTTQIQKMLLIVAALLALGVSGCNSTTKKNHDTWVSEADGRWKEMRSGLMLNVATQQFETGDLDAAEKTVRGAMELDPKNARLHLLAGRIAIERGKLERAYGRIENAIALDDKLPAAHYFQGIILQRWNQHDAALEEYRKAYDLQPDNVNYLLATTEMMVASDKSDDALELLKSRLDYFEQSAGARSAVGEIYMSRREFDKAVPYLQQAAVMAPDDLQIAENLAASQFAARQFADAQRNLAQLCERKELADRADLFLALGRCYEQLNRLDPAETIYRKLTHDHPEDGNAWIRLGEVSWAKQNLPATALAGSRAVKLAPTQPQGYILQGLVSQHRGEVGQAISLFEQAAKVAPDDASPLILRGLALERAGRTKEAAAEYQRALDRNPKDAQIQQLLARAESENITQP